MPDSNKGTVSSQQLQTNLEKINLVKIRKSKVNMTPPLFLKRTPFIKEIHYEGGLFF